MSQTAIGKAALVLSVNGTGMRSGLGSAGKDVRKWADDTGRSLSSRMGAAGRAAGASTSSGLMSGLGGAATRALGPIAAVAAGAVGVQQGLQTIADTARGGAAAKAFGLSAEQFTGMAGVAASVGEGQREFIESLVTLGKVASEGAAGKGEVATAWFKSLGMDAKQFKSLNLEDQFYTVFEAIQKVEDPAERVRALMVAFGEDGGKYLLPLLSKTPQEVRAMGAGFAVSTQQVQEATVAHNAMTLAQGALSRGWRAVAIAFAPLVGLISAGLTRIEPLFGWVGKAIGGWLSVAGDYWSTLGAIAERVGGWLAPAAEKVGRAFEVVRYVGAALWDEAVGLFHRVADGIGVVIDQVGGWLSALFSAEGTILSVEQVTFVFLRMAAQGFGYLWDTIKVGVGVFGYAQSWIVDGLAVLVETFKGTIKQLLDVAAILPDELGGGVFRRLSGTVDGWGSGLHQIAQGMRATGVNAFETWGDSAVQAGEWIDGLQQRMGQAPAAAAAAAAQGAVAVRAAATAAVASAVKLTENGALLKGSSAEVSMRIKNDFNGSTPQERMLEQQKLANRHLGDISAGIGDLLGKAGTGLLAL